MSVFITRREIPNLEAYTTVGLALYEVFHVDTAFTDDLLVDHVSVSLWSIREDNGHIRLVVRVVELPITIVNRSARFVVFISLTLGDPYSRKERSLVLVMV